MHFNTIIHACLQVAVKVINKKKARQDAYVKRNLRREARVMQQLRHANIIQLYEVIETDNSYYLVMELCRGGGLMEHICAKRRLSESESCRYMRQILSAVHYMHRAGVIHRSVSYDVVHKSVACDISHKSVTHDVTSLRITLSTDQSLKNARTSFVCTHDTSYSVSLL